MTEILLATDAPWIADEITSILAASDVDITVVSEGREVRPRVLANVPDLLIADFQIGSMGGVAVSLDIRLDEGVGSLPHIPVLLLCDRRADVFLARRAQVDGFLIKPIEVLRLRRAVSDLLLGGSFEDASYAPENVSSVGELADTTLT